MSRDIKHQRPYLIVGILIALFVAFVAQHPGLLILVREAMFATPISKANAYLPPDRLIADGFLPEHSDPAALRQHLGAPTTDSAERPLDVTQRLIRSFSVGGGPGCSSFAGTLESERAWLQAGHGCCSDHTDVLTNTAESYGIFVREVSNNLHTFAEFYDAGRGRWIFVDPMGALFATDELGEPLSALELRERLLSSRTVHWMMFGVSATQPADTTSPWFRVTYGIGESRTRAWEFLLYTWGNNVVRQRTLPQLRGTLGRAVSQLAWRTLRITPRYRIIVDERSRAHHREILLVRLVFVLLAVAGVGGTTWYLYNRRHGPALPAA